jgi:hypothetical protein
VQVLTPCTVQLLDSDMLTATQDLYDILALAAGSLHLKVLDQLSFSKQLAGPQRLLKLHLESCSASAGELTSAAAGNIAKQNKMVNPAPMNKLLISCLLHMQFYLTFPVLLIALRPHKPHFRYSDSCLLHAAALCLTLVMDSDAWTP